MFELRSHIKPREVAGFTLIEMVVAIAVSGILVAGIISYIGDSVVGYDTAAERNKLAQDGRIAIDRLSVELHNALPNSFRVSTATAGGDQCIEFVPVVATTSYINPPLDAAGSSFNVVEFNPTREGTTSGYIAIYPTQVNQIYNAETGSGTGFPNTGPINTLSSIQDTSPSSTQQSLVTLASSHRFSDPSPNNRLFLVEDPISYCVKGSRLYRYTDYGFYNVQTTTEAATGVCSIGAGDRCLPSSSGGGSKMLIVDGINNSGISAFKLLPQTLARNALVSIEFNFSKQNNTILMNHQVLTRSVP